MTERNEGAVPETTATEQRPPAIRTRNRRGEPILIGGRRGNAIDVVVLTGTRFSYHMRGALRVGARGHTGRRRRF